MTSVFALLSLPATSKAFTALQPTLIDSSSSSPSLAKPGVKDSTFTGSASSSPPRKAIRLVSDSDAPSASRSSTGSLVAAIPSRSSHAGLAGPDVGQAKVQTGPLRIQILDDSAAPVVLQTTMTTASATRQRDTPFELLRKCITILLTKDSPEPLPATYEAIYRACQSVVTISANGEGLYDRLKIELERCLTRLVEDLMNSPGMQRGASMNVDGENHGSVEWLGQFVQICQWFEDQIVLLRSLLTYLDQVYVVATPGLLSVKDLAYSIFASNTFENWRIVERWQAGVKDWLSWERRVRLDHELRLYIPALVSHLVSHRQYANFEAYYIDITQEFYKADSEQHAETMKADPRDFFRHVRRRIEEEDQRSKDVLLAGSLAPVRVVVEKSLLEGRLDWISTTVGPYMEVNDLDSLSSMYKLFSRVGALKVLCAAFKGYMLNSVKTIVTDEVLDDDMVGRLLQLKASADVAIHGAFYDTKPSGGLSNTSLKVGTTSSTTQVPNQEFIYALSDAFTTGFKARRNKPAEMIAKYLDKAMRKGQGTSSDSAFEKILDDALALYRFTDDKDVFRTFYHRALAKRLLLEKSASDDFEKAMLKKLKENYDPEFGMGEEMFKDLALSKEMMRDYHSKLPWDSFGQSLSVVVLQRSAWPFIARDKTIDLPLDMQDELTRYAGYYKQRHSGHTLSWDHALGTATLKARFKAGTKDLSVSLYQGVVLLLFNEAEELKYDEILEATRLDETELKRTLQSLACGKKRVLKKVPMGREVENGDVFRFNADFDDPHPKVHINSIQAKVSPEESKRTQVSVEGDRKLSLDAAIVRIMKAKKEMTYEKLKAATIDAVKNHFVPQVDVIKKRVDALVENEYLERSKRDKNVFLYVA